MHHGRPQHSSGGGQEQAAAHPCSGQAPTSCATPETQTCARWETPRLSSPYCYPWVSGFALQQLHICSATFPPSGTARFPSSLPINSALINQRCPDQRTGLEHHMQSSTGGCSQRVWETGKLEELGAPQPGDAAPEAVQLPATGLSQRPRSVSKRQ